MNPIDMLIKKKSVEYLKTDEKYFEHMMERYKVIIDYAKDLQHGNFSHGMSTIRHLLKFCHTTIFVKYEDEELFNMSYNMAMVGESLLMGAYEGEEKLQKLKEIIRDCEIIMEKINFIEINKECE